MLDYMAANVLYLDNDQVAKNYYLYCDTNDGANATYDYANANGTNEWGMAPWDKDLTFGKCYFFTDYQIGDPYAHPFFGDSDHRKIDGPYNWMMDVLLDIPEIKQMYLRRLRTMMDEFLQPPGTPYNDRFFEARFDELYAKLMGDPLVKSYLGDLQSYFNDIKTKYLDPRRTHLYVDHSLNASYPDFAGIPAEQAAFVQVDFGSYEVSPASGNQDQEYLTLVNPNGVAVDVSGWKLTGGISLTFKKGVVIPAGGTLYVSPNVYAFRQRTTGPSGNQALLVQGNYSGYLSKWGESVRLIDPAGDIVSTLATPVNPSLAQQYLRITELMYHPADPPSGGYTNDDFQFVELKNTSATQTLSLAGVRFTDGIAFDFTGSGVTSLAPGARVLVVSNLTAFQSRYGTGWNGIIAGQFAKMNPADLDITHLAKSGEKITLVDSVGETILSFSYQDDWYKQTDGAGNSLVIRDAAAADRGLWGERVGWSASHAANGSPGADETPAYAAGVIVVNELLSHRTDEPGALGDWVEFYNATSSPIDIGGWYLSNDDADLKKFEIAAGTVIPAYGYKAFNWRDNFGSTANAGCITPFTFGELGGDVYLTSAAAGALTEFQANESFGSIDTGITFGRYIKSTGGKDFVATSSPTYEAPNTPPAVGPVVINEIYYHPDTGKDSFIELKNISGQTVPLYDPANPQNTWHLAEGVQFAFPAGAAISAGGYALIVNIDPAYFRTKYGIPASVPIYGPYLYELDNGGDTVELKYPDDPQPDGKVPYDRMDQVTYEDGGLWPKAADGFRASLSRIAAADYGNDVANWTAGWPTPGADNAAFSASPITIMTPATATPGTVTGTTTNLTVVADSSAGASSLTYEWSVTALPDGAPDPTFSVNRSADASNTTATFFKAGTYAFTVTISNYFGASITSNVNVTVVPTETSFGIAPSSLILVPNETRQFVFATLDQFGGIISALPNVSWSATAGTIDSATGLYTAPASANPSITINATSGTAMAGITIQTVLPYAWWKFDEGTGTTTADASGHNRTGVLSGSTRPAWTTGESGNALSFNGTTSYVYAPSLNLYSNTVTIAAWIKRNGDNVDWGPIVFARGGNTCAGLGFGGAGTNELRYHWNVDQYYWSTGLIVPDDTWTFIALVVQSDRATVYMKPINAGLQSAVNYVSNSAEEFDATTYIGQDPIGGRIFRGTIDDVRIYNSSLSAGAIAAMADSPPTNISLSNTSVPENEPGAIVGSLTTADPGEDNFAYLLRNDPTGMFEIAGSNLKLKAGQSFDYETTPNAVVTIRSIDSGGLYFDKTFTISIVNVPEPMIVAAANWTAAGTSAMTLKLAADGKLHIYKTGTTDDVVAAQWPADVSAVYVTGRGTGDVFTVESMGTGASSLVVHDATLTVSQNYAIPATTDLTIDGGALMLGGYADTFGTLAVINGGQATATSIVCDSLVIGSAAAAGSSSLANAAGAAVAKNGEMPPLVNTVASAVAVNADGQSPASDSTLTASSVSPILDVQPIAENPFRIATIPAKTISAASTVVPNAGDGDSCVENRSDALLAADSPQIPILSRISPVLQPLEEFVTSRWMPAAVDAPPIMPEPRMLAYRMSRPENDVASPAYLSLEKLPSLDRAADGPSDRHATLRGAATNGRQEMRLAVLQSALEEYRASVLAEYADRGVFPQNRGTKPPSRFAKAVDAALDAELGAGDE